MNTNQFLRLFGLIFAFPLFANAADGDLDTSFNFVGFSLQDMGLDVFDVVIQPNGKIIVLGTTNEGDGLLFALLRLNPDGSADSTFGTSGKVTHALLPGPSSVPLSLVVLPDTKIIVAGRTGGGNQYDFALLRLLPNGARDTSFGLSGVITTNIGSGADSAVGIAVLPDGKIVVGGFAGGGFDFAVVRYLANGELDTSFGGDGIVTTAIVFAAAYPESMVVQPDGKIVLGGWMVNSSDCAAGAARYNTDGTLDTNFDGDGIAVANVGSPCEFSGLKLQPDGKLVLAGFAPGGVDGDQALVRLNSNGSLDTSFGGDGLVHTAIGTGNNRAYDLVIQPDGKIITAGEATIASLDFALARYNRDGSLDSSNFGIAGIVTTPLGDSDTAKALKLQADGRIVAAGISFGTKFAVARYQNTIFANGFE